MKLSRRLTTGSSLAVLLSISGCSTTGLKQENIDLKQQVQAEEQMRKDYADRLRAASKISEEERASRQAEVASMQRDLNKVLSEKQVVIKKLEDLTIIEMQQSVLFSSGQAELSQEGKALVKSISTAFNKYDGYHMRVEGHTDNMPIRAQLKQRYFSNWELSAARAASVVRYMVYGLGVSGKNLSIAGYADNRPIASNDTDEGRMQNRRIRVVVFKNPM